jgi:hypothetical protein
MGVCGQNHALAAVPLHRDLVAIVEEARWAAGPVQVGAGNLASTGLRSPDLPGCRQLLYSLSYPGSPTVAVIFLIICYMREAENYWIQSAASCVWLWKSYVGVEVQEAGFVCDYTRTSRGTQRCPGWAMVKPDSSFFFCKKKDRMMCGNVLLWNVHHVTHESPLYLCRRHTHTRARKRKTVSWMNTMSCCTINKKRKTCNKIRMFTTPTTWCSCHGPSHTSESPQTGMVRRNTHNL